MKNGWNLSTRSATENWVDLTEWAWHTAYHLQMQGSTSSCDQYLLYREVSVVANDNIAIDSPDCCTYLSFLVEDAPDLWVCLVVGFLKFSRSPRSRFSSRSASVTCVTTLASVATICYKDWPIPHPPPLIAWMFLASRVVCEAVCRLHVTATLPGLKVEYSTDNGLTWNDVIPETEVNTEIQLRTRSALYWFLITRSVLILPFPLSIKYNNEQGWSIQNNLTKFCPRDAIRLSRTNPLIWLALPLKALELHCQCAIVNSLTISF